MKKPKVIPGQETATKTSDEVIENKNLRIALQIVADKDDNLMYLIKSEIPINNIDKQKVQYFCTPKRAREILKQGEEVSNGNNRESKESS
ncbi:MAG: hypothetical protein ACOCUI_00360 [bacterium]